MQKALGLVDAALKLYNKAVLRARNLQARHIVDALYGRYRYQLDRENTTLSFGEWLLEKRNLSGTYAKLGIDTVLWAFTGIVSEAQTDSRFRFFYEKQQFTDWLTPLIEFYVNRRVVESFYKIRVTSYTVPLSGYKQALSSLNFVRDRIAGQHA